MRSMERKQLQLQPRLALLAEMVPRGCRLADIGTDHGYLPVYLMQRGDIAAAIAADIVEGPLEHARRTAEEYGVENIAFRLCDGLSGIAPEEADTLVIAGMGGETVITILESAAWTAAGQHTLLLQPMTKVSELRRWLGVSGFTFTEERLVWDKGYLYPVLRVTGGGRPTILTERQALCGMALQSDPLYGDYLAQHAEKLRKAAAGLRRSHRENALAEADAMEALALSLEKERDAL